MNGVEILSSETIYTTKTIGWILPVFTGAGGLIFAIIDWIYMGFNSESIVNIFVCATFGFVIGALGTLMFIHNTDEVNYIEYKVIVSEEVSLVEFMDKYEILDQEGKIYTVRERE